MAGHVGQDDQRGMLGGEIAIGAAVVVEGHSAHGEGVATVGTHIPDAGDHLHGAFPCRGVAFGTDGTHPHIIGRSCRETGKGAGGSMED